ncbi:MAG: hypothetical protein IIC81_06510 [Chloroflexi bacterium]|nr:hypothetical protein [Chloroflexota bacterium]
MVIETSDRFYDLTESDFPGGEDSLINTINGPVCTGRANPENTVKIDILDITPSSEEAYVIAMPG